MKLIRVIAALMMVFVLTGCAATKVDSGIQKLELGMTKKKVTSILGNQYESIGARATPDGPVESIGYYSLSLIEGESYYVLSFKDNMLIEWFKEKLPQKQHNHPNK